MLAVFRRRRGTAADLARLLAGWLVAIVLVQGLAAGLTLVRGPAHRHTDATLARLGASHAQAHEAGQAHVHAAATDLALPADAEIALDVAALLLLGTLAMLAAAHAWPLQRPRGVWVAAALWAVAAHTTAPPRRPPRG